MLFNEFSQIVIQISGPNFTEKGDPIRISCNASSDSTVPDFMDWFLNGRKLKTDTEAGISITEYRHRDTRTLYSTLEIRKSTMDDAGTYICRNSRRDVVSHHVIILNGEFFSKQCMHTVLLGSKLSIFKSTMIRLHNLSPEPLLLYSLGPYFTY